MKKKNYIRIFLMGVIVSFFTSCNESILKEIPLSNLSQDNVYNSKAAFTNGIIGLHANARDEQIIHLNAGENLIYEMSLGTDVAMPGERNQTSQARFWDYSIITSYYPGSESYWNWAYKEMIANANTIISRADNTAIDWTDEAEKNAIIAEAKFFRGYTYNILVNLFGGVPLVVDEIKTPKLDFVRASRLEVLKQVQSDLEYAAQWLPVNESVDGRISQGAANHLLSEVYISLGLETKDASYYDKSIAAASKVIGSGKYKLMTTRFGANKTQAGDVFHDLFWDYNVNRSSGNTETIWAQQYEYQITGGAYSESNWPRAWGSRYWDLKDPDGKSGMVYNDTLGRSVGWIRPTNLIFYDCWKADKNDMRNSKYNIHRDWYWNNPTSAYYGQKVKMLSTMDTIYVIYPYIGKLSGDFKTVGSSSGTTAAKDIYIMRLAETYLLRAEAYMWKGDLVNAAADINVIRARAQAKLASSSEINIDYILDERARELIVEEPRRRTLVRVGKLYERTKKYNPISGLKIQPYNELWPIPQSAIDGNVGAKLEQNPGY